jgi:uncharacterized repeat protein (TIGR03803 family)
VISVSDGSTLQLEQSAIGYFSRAGNAGLISVGGTVSGPATLYDEGQIRLEGGSIDVSSLTIIAGGELSGFGTVASPIESSGVINARDGKMDLAGPVTRDGQFLISQAATLELGGPTAQAVTFESGGGGTLYLDKATEFSGTVTGLAQADSVDFADFAFSSHPLITNVTGTGAVGSTTDVTIADGSLITTLELLNQYAGEYPIASTAYHLESDHPGSPSAGTLFTTIANPPITAVATSVSGTEGVAISGATVATFTDANPNALASDFTATIDWDDGTTTTGTIVAQTGGDFAVDGTHTYADGGEYAVGVNITDVSGGTASITTSATVAELATLSTLVTFQSNGANPFGPVGGLIADADGDLFGLTAGGGANGDGTVFEIAKTATGYASTPTTLASFNGANGAQVFGGLIADNRGDLFGTTSIGGAFDDGTVFEIAKTATGYASSPTTLVSFNGVNPQGSLIVDANGDLFGTIGGSSGDSTVFEIAKTANGYASTPTTLVSFNGASPEGSLIADANGDLFGTTGGTVFEITDSGFVALAINGTTITATEGSTTGTIPIATFTDANPNATASDFTATIDWGDGSTTAGTIVAQSGGGFAVDGEHTYADEGKYAVGVSIKDVDGSSASATGTATVADAPLTATGVSISGTEGSSTGTIPVATFTDANPNASGAKGHWLGH